MKKAVPIIFIGGVAAVIIYLLTGMGAIKEDPPGPITMPEQIGAFKRTELTEGKEALLAFERQHKKKIPIKEGAKGLFTDGSVKVEFWIANGAGPTHAGQMFLDMAAKIGTAHEIFSGPKPLDLNGVTGYRTDGQEATNFFFTKDGRVYWIAVKGGDPEAVAKAFVAESFK